MASDNSVRRVLMTADTIGGVWTFALDLSASLSDWGVEVLLATLGKSPTPSQLSDAAQISRLRVASSTFKLEWMEDPWSDVYESGEWLLRLEREFEPDIVHLNSFGHGALPWRTPTIVTAHSCVASWWAAVHREPLPSEWRRYKTTVAECLKCVNRIVSPSRAMHATLRGNYGVPASPNRFSVILNGRRARLFHPKQKEAFILTAGRLWDQAKNVAAVAAVATELEWPVFLAGESRHPEGGQVSARGCRVLGQLAAAQLADYYSRAPIFSLPARYEPFGLSALEAALSGCALVLGDIASLREVWGDAACFVDPDDTGALSAALRELIANRSLREEMAARAYAHAQAFTADRMAVEYLAAYQSALKEDYACVS
jgi:glycosyltransferase involved in cell wall biosynthesis